jgi:hypothetical protein
MAAILILRVDTTITYELASTLRRMLERRRNQGRTCGGVWYHHYLQHPGHTRLRVWCTPMWNKNTENVTNYLIFSNF